MSHIEERNFCKEVRNKYPFYFVSTNVIDIGSQDINGNNRYLFSDCNYIGIDIMKGKNVDKVIPIHKLQINYTYGTLISTEMLEHDRYWKQSLHNMYSILREGGLFLLTCATKGRKEHGTYVNEMKSSPATVDYYHNITLKEFEKELPKELFEIYELRKKGTDLQFYGIKKIKKEDKITIIVPTMYYHVQQLQKMIDVYDRIPYIHEIIIVNNCKEKHISFKGQKIKEINDGNNLFVNASWKLGAEMAETNNLCFVNDDIMINKDLNELFFNIIIGGLQNKVIGPSEHCFKNKKLYKGNIKIEKCKARNMNYGFGVFFFVNKQDFLRVNIPKEIKVWYGDMILYDRLIPYNYLGIEITTEFAGTTKKIDLKGVLAEEKKIYEQYYKKYQITVACVLKTKGEYDISDVLKLQNMVKRNTTIPIDFICLSDVDVSGVKTILLKDNLPEWWSKIELFRPDIFITDRIFYIDLDTVIVDNIDDILKYDYPFIGLKDFYKYKQTNRNEITSGLMHWRVQDFYFLYDNFRKEFIKKYRGDQDYINTELRKKKIKPNHWQFILSGIVSFKKHCRNGLYEGAKIVCFHGKPRPRMVQTKWMERNWK